MFSVWLSKLFYLSLTFTFAFLFKLFSISLSTFVCKENFSPFRNFSGTDIFLSLIILLLLFIMFAYNRFKSVIMIDLSFSFTIGLILGGSTGKYFIINQLGCVLVCIKEFNKFILV